MAGTIEYLEPEGLLIKEKKLIRTDGQGAGLPPTMESTRGPCGPRT